jgi:hypothetical protein
MLVHIKNAPIIILNVIFSPSCSHPNIRPKIGTNINAIDAFEASILFSTQNQTTNVKAVENKPLNNVDKITSLDHWIEGFGSNIKEIMNKNIVPIIHCQAFI